MSKQNKPTWAKMKSKKRKGFVRTSKLIICGDVLYLDNESVSYMQHLNDDIK